MKKIRLCSMCGSLGEQHMADDQVAYRVLGAAKIDMRASRGKWRVRVWVCKSCDTPTIELYPELMSQDARRELLGIDDAPLEIEEKGGTA